MAKVEDRTHGACQRSIVQLPVCLRQQRMIAFLPISTALDWMAVLGEFDGTQARVAGSKQQWAHRAVDGLEEDHGKSSCHCFVVDFGAGMLSRHNWITA